MKVLHLIYTNGIAGAEKYLMHLLPALRKLDFDCHIIIVCAPGAQNILQNYCDALQREKVPVKLIITSRKNFLNAAHTINQYLRAHHIKILHSHLLNSDVLATVVKVLFYKKLVIISTKHGYKETVLRLLSGSLSKETLLKIARKEMYYYVTKYIIKKSDYNYAVSSAVAALYYDLKLSKVLMPFIHHGVSVKEVQKTEGLSNYRFSNHQLIIVGRLEEFKGHRYLVEAMPSVITKFPGCRLLILGEGSEKNHLQDIVVKLKIENNVSFIGFNSDPYSFVKNSDVVILPSLFEPFGLVYIEAFALGTPVVAFDTAAGNEIMSMKKQACW